MTFQHTTAASGHWNQFSLIEQMANIGSEVHRAINWKTKGVEPYAQTAFERSLELFDLTLADPKNRQRLKEVARARECWADYFFGDNQYSSTAESWERYFYQFNYAARIGK